MRASKLEKPNSSCGQVEPMVIPLIII